MTVIHVIDYRPGLYISLDQYAHLKEKITQFMHDKSWHTPMLRLDVATFSHLYEGIIFSMLEKLRSLLKFGAFSTRYKDVFDIYYLIDKIDARKLSFCFRSYIFE